jgi:hypothetical protein
MKVFLQTPENDIIILAGDGRLGQRVFPDAEGFELGGELERQVVRRVRGSHARAHARGNVRHRAFFRTRRVFPTPAEAQDWAEQTERNFPRSGLLYFITVKGTRKLHDSVVAPPAITVTGCEARMIYQAEGGEFSPLEPELVIDGVSGLQYRLVADDVAKWFEVGFDVPFLLDGNAADGWTDPGGYLRFRVERSLDLVTWDHNVIDAPSSPETITGGYRYWARINQPLIWKYVRVDLTLTSTRAGKGITELRLFDDALALTGYPYAMPADAARLQSDLRALGYAGATVSSVSYPLSVEVTDHSSELDAVPFPVTLVGADVTDVKNSSGTTIPLDYPYTMPAQAAALKDALVAAGYTYASARCYADEWTIFIPNRDTVFNDRVFQATITPADSYTYVGLMGVGTDDGDTIMGSSGNVRATTGSAPLQEAAKQFARLGVSAGPNHLY